MSHKAGLFPICFEIGGDQPGGPSFKAHFIVYTPAERVTGFGVIIQAISGFRHIDTEMKGNYTLMTIASEQSGIIIAAHGYPPVAGPTIGTAATAALPNADLRMVLTQDWQSGTANYKYKDSEGLFWHRSNCLSHGLTKSHTGNTV